MTMPDLLYKGIAKKIVPGNQSTNEIINEVINAHSFFARDYDALASYFDVGSAEAIGKKLFNYCKKNIRYKVESVNDQTTRSAAALIRLGHGDCKHYAGFIAGVLDAINRTKTGKPIDWAYRFASYDAADTTPTHVFIVIKTGSANQELWIDPVLDEIDKRTPYPAYWIDKKPTKMLRRLSGTSDSEASGSGTSIFSQASNLYDLAAGKAQVLDGLVASSVPFYALAKGLVTQFFGPGGISDWLTPSGILNELKTALFGRLFRGGQYWLGEKFKYYILGEDIHTRDADVVTDAAVTTAITVFSTGFGVPVEDFQDIINLQAGRDAYIKRYTTLGADVNDINVLAVDRAVNLKQQYFPFSEVAKGVVPNKWNPANFNKIPFVVPIPNFTAAYPQMWKQTYSGPIPGGEVVKGVVITGKLKEAGGAATASGSSMSGGTWLLLGAAAIGGYFLLKKHKRYY